MLLIQMDMNVLHVILMKYMNKNMNKNKVFYNAVINEDLFYTIYDYLRFNPSVQHKYYNDVVATNCWDEMSIEDWQDVAADAIHWLTNEQCNKVYVVTPEDNAPNMETWGTLYYQTLAYIYRTKSNVNLHHSDIYVTMDLCHKCIDDLTRLAREIHEPTDDDI